MAFGRLVVTSLCLVFLIAGTCGATGEARRGTRERAEDVEQLINELIEQLGADQYARRERAQEQLRELGVIAFDALLGASQHQDVEIALRARYLVRSMPVQWSREDDPPTVRNILANYSHVGRDERQNRMQHLTAIPNSAGIPALCRLMRFESDGLLSKQAALYVLGHDPPQDAAQRDQLATTIGETVGLSQRPAAIWLRTYAQTLRDPASTVDRWETLVDEEARELAQFPERTDREIVRDLFRWHADTLRRLDRQEAFLLVIQRTLDLIEGDRSELFDFVDWALEREAWTVVDEVAKRYPTEFYKHAILVYRLAEAQMKRGEDALADQTAEKALAIDPNTPESHNLLARYLTSRLLYKWAEAEYRHVIKQTRPTPNDNLHLEARFYLSDLMYDLERYAEAAEVMQGVVEAIERDRKVLQPFPRRADEVRGTMYYYRALASHQRGEYTLHRQQLQQAIELYPSNPDILIAMHQAPEADEAFRQDTRQRIEISQGRLRTEIEGLERLLENPRKETERLENMDLTATASNELAWLIANTEGNFEAALRHSRRSLQLKPDSPAYLDTLGRCYFALGDYENAVKYQTKAVERAPSYQQIRRQLELFETALAQSREKKKEAG